MSIKLFTNFYQPIPVAITKFPDRTPLIHIDPANFKDAESVTIQWRYQNDAELFQLILITRFLQDNDVKTINLFMPYIPNARFDRINNPDEVFTLKYFAEVINSLKFHQVEVLDAHSNVSLALFDRVVQHDIKPIIQQAIKQFHPDVLFMPDEGAHKRYGKLFNLPSTFGIKTRDWRTGDIKDYFLAEPELVAHKRVLIIDDICSRGGTFYYAGKLLKQHHADAIGLYVSHCEPNIANGKVLDPTQSHIDQVYTADLLFDQEPIDDDNPLKKIKKLY